MNFLAPAAFILGLLLPVIIALYLLKLRRIEREVPSTYLWRQMVRDVEANAPWQKLRPNLLMILQLLFLTALILALTRPFTWVEGASGQAAIFILDTSASMSATDVAPSRFESARQRARQLVDDLPGTSRVTIIEAGREARVLLSSSLDRRQAHLALEQAQPGTGGSDMNVALELASAIASRQPGTEIIVFSDGRVDLPQHMAIKGALRYLPFGLSGENQAISLLNLEPSSGSGSLTAFTQVSNYGSQPATRRLNLYADGLLVDTVDLTDIPAGGQKNAITEGLPPETRILEARLAGQDALPLDDRAYAVRPTTHPVPVTLVTQGNLFIQTALNLLPGVVLTEQEAAAPAPALTPPSPTQTATPVSTKTPVSSQAGPPSLTIYDNTVPDTLPTSGSLLFIAPTRSTAYFSTTGLVQAPAARVIDPSDPLVQNANLADISILDAVQVPLPDWATPVIAGDLPDGNTPLIFRGEIDTGQRVAVIAFDLRHSDLPLQVAFPVLWSNLIDWLTPGGRGAVPTLITPGDTLTLNAPESSPQATITRPDGSNVQVQAESGRIIFTDTVQIGTYHIRFQPAQSSSQTVDEADFAVNLFSPKESNLKPADNLPGVEAENTQSGAIPQRAMREWWRPLVLLALGLLTGEWLVYQRSALSRIRDAVLRRPLRIQQRAGKR